MTRLPGYGRFAKKISNYLAKRQFANFKSSVPEVLKLMHFTSKTFAANIVSFSGSKTFEEQLYSIFSFYNNVGRPNSWTLYSDGSHTTEQKQLFLKIPGLQIFKCDLFLDEKYSELIELGKYNIWANRLHAYLNHPIDGRTIFTDSDVLFFRKFREYNKIIEDFNWFIADTSAHFDDYFIKNICGSPKPPFVNAGFLIINQKPNWNKAVDYLINRDDYSSWEHFSEQASIHYMLSNDINTKVLNKDDFILSCSDSFKFGCDFDPKKIALRHYVSPVRHKMWQYSWKKW